MKKLLTVILSVFFILTLFNQEAIANVPDYASFVSDGQEGKIRTYTNFINMKDGISVREGKKFISELPGINIHTEDHKDITGNFTYPNYDNTRLGVWNLEWVFTPDDDNYEVLEGYITIKVLPREDDIVEEPTTPSLTATAVTLNTRTAYDINLDNKVVGSTYKWTSSDPDIVEVNTKNGKLKAISEGSATITCEIALPDGTTQTLTSIVTVGYDENAPELTETVLDLEIGDTFDINLENKIAKSSYRWASSDRDIIIVNSSNGKVTAEKSGEAFVTCTITTPENQVIVLRCDINVTDPVPVTE